MISFKNNVMGQFTDAGGALSHPHRLLTEYKMPGERVTSTIPPSPSFGSAESPLWHLSISPADLAEKGLSLAVAWC